MWYTVLQGDDNMASETVSIRMDKDLKNAFSFWCGKLGLTPTAAFVVFATQVVEKHKIPFEISAADDLFFTHPANRDRVRRAIERLEAGQGTAHEPAEEGDA
jgi:addiction module RelB/DinJ family antitoxin